jgi:hypothetical protein
MAETPVEVIIRARNEAQAALNQAIGQMKQLQASTKQAGDAGAGLRGLRDAIGQISPAAGQAVARIEAMAGAGAAFGVIGTAAVGAVTAIGLVGAAAFAAAKNLGDAVEQLDNFARVTGASVGDVQVLGELFERQGLSADVARTALHRLNVAIGEGNPLLARLGVTARDPTQALLQLADAFATSTDAGARARIAQELLGRGGSDLLAVLDSLRTAFPALRIEMTATGQLMSDDMVEAGRLADASFERFGGRLAGVMNRLKNFAAVAVEVATVTNPVMAALFGPVDVPDGATGAIDRQAERIEKRIATLRATLVKESDNLDTIHLFDRLAPEGVIREAEGRIAGLERQIATLADRLTTLRSAKPVSAGVESKAVADALLAAIALENAEAAAKRLGAQVESVNNQLAKVALGDEGIRRLAKSFAEGATSVEDLLRQFKDVGLAVEIIRAAEPFKPMESAAKALAETLKIPVEAARNLVAELEKAEALSPRGGPAPVPIPGPDVPLPVPQPAVDLGTFARGQVLEDWRAFVDEVTSSAAVLNDVLGGIQSSLQAGFTQVFQGMLGSAQTFGSAMATIFRAMVNEIIAQLARLLAFKILRLLLGDVTALAPTPSPVQGLGAGLGLSAGGVVRGPGTETSDNIPALLSPGEFVVRAAAVRRPGVRAQLESINRGAAHAFAAASTRGGFSMPRITMPQINMPQIPAVAGAATADPWAAPTSPGQQSGNTYIIQTIEAHDLVASLVLPGGSLRRANDRVQVAEAY